MPFTEVGLYMPACINGLSYIRQAELPCSDNPSDLNRIVAACFVPKTREQRGLLFNSFWK